MNNCFASRECFLHHHQASDGKRLGAVDDGGSWGHLPARQLNPTMLQWFMVVGMFANS